MMRSVSSTTPTRINSEVPPKNEAKFRLRPQIWAMAGRIATMPRNIEPGKRDSRHDGVKIVYCRLAGLDARDEAVVTLHILSHLGWTNRNRGVEICERHDHDEVD